MKTGKNKEKQKRNEKIRKEYADVYVPGMKAEFIYRDLSIRYNLTVSAIGGIVQKRGNYK